MPKPATQPTTAQSPGALEIRARHHARGQGPQWRRRPPAVVLPQFRPYRPGGDYLVVRFPGPPLRVSPGFNISGFQPASVSGPKARNVIAWAEASPTSGG